MYTPSHKVKVAAVLWAQGFNAGQMSTILGVSPKAVYQRLGRMKKRDFESWSRMNEIRRCHSIAKTSVKDPHRYADLGRNEDNTVTWYDLGVPVNLRVLQVF